MKYLIFAFCLFATPLSMCGQSICFDSEFATGEFAAGEFAETKYDCSEKSIEKHPLSIYPNPTTDFFEVIGFGEDSEGAIFNALGQFVRRVDVRGIVNVSDLPQGIYFLKFQYQTVKFIKT